MFAIEYSIVNSEYCCGIINAVNLTQTCEAFMKRLTRSLREPAGPCTKSMEVSESRMERVKRLCTRLFSSLNCVCKIDYSEI